MKNKSKTFDTLLDFQLSKNCRELNAALTQFNMTFTSAEDCYEFLYIKIYGKNPIKCTCCGGTVGRKRFGERISSCIECGKTFSITTGTFFEKTKKIKCWFTAIWLLECGIEINPLALSRITGLAYSSAWQIFQKVSMVIANSMETGNELISSSEFFRVISRRSTCSPPNQHPVEELNELATDTIHNATEHGEARNEIQLNPTPNLKSNSSTNEISSATDQDLTNNERLVLESISEKPVSFDRICINTGLSAKDVAASLAILELNFTVKVLYGNKYVRKTESSNLRKQNESYQKSDFLNRNLAIYLDKIESFVKSNHKGISLKYLQNYLALATCPIISTKWRNNKLFEVCFKARAITYSKLKALESPRLVRVLSS